MRKILALLSAQCCTMSCVSLSVIIYQFRCAVTISIVGAAYEGSSEDWKFVLWLHLCAGISRRITISPVTPKNRLARSSCIRRRIMKRRQRVKLAPELESVLRLATPCTRYTAGEAEPKSRVNQQGRRWSESASRSMVRVSRKATKLFRAAVVHSARSRAKQPTRARAR